MLYSVVIVTILALMVNAQSNITIDPIAAKDLFSTILQNVGALNLSQIPADLERNVSEQFVQIFQGKTVRPMEPPLDIPDSTLLTDLLEPLTETYAAQALGLNSTAGVSNVTVIPTHSNFTVTYNGTLRNLVNGNTLSEAAPVFDSNPATCRYAVVYSLEETKSMLRSMGGNDWEMNATWPDSSYKVRILESTIPTDVVFETNDFNNFTAQVVQHVGQQHDGDGQQGQFHNVALLFDTAGATSLANTTLGRELVARTSSYFTPGPQTNPANSSSVQGQYTPFDITSATVFYDSTRGDDTYTTAIMEAMYQEKVNTMTSYEAVTGIVACHNDSLSFSARSAFEQADMRAQEYTNSPLVYNGRFDVRDVNSGDGKLYNCTANLIRRASAHYALVENPSNIRLPLNTSYASVMRDEFKKELYSVLTNGNDKQPKIIPVAAGASSGIETNSRSFAAGMLSSDRINATMSEHVEAVGLSLGFPNATLQQDFSPDYDASVITGRTSTRVYIVVAVVNNCTARS